MSRVLALAVATTLLTLTACNGTKEESSEAPAAPTTTEAAPESAPETAAPAEPAEAPAMTESSAETAPEAATPAEEAKPVEEPAAKTEAPAETGPLTEDQAMALARKGNCVACHKIDSKLVGPAWRDVATKYKGDPKAAATIASHIKAGGSFGWKFGVMPPRGGSQLSDADVDSLAKFIVGLK